MTFSLFPFLIRRSITLVGEKERKVLKEVVKNAKFPVKNRVISSGTVGKRISYCAPLSAGGLNLLPNFKKGGA